MKRFYDVFHVNPSVKVSTVHDWPTLVLNIVLYLLYTQQAAACILDMCFLFVISTVDFIMREQGI
jgi:hypothetical protein